VHWRTPKEIARALKMPPSAVAPLIRSVAAAEGRTREDALIGCWISPGWSSSVQAPERPDWPGSAPSERTGHSGLVTVLVARDRSGSAAGVCFYLVDTWCLGLKNAAGPQSMGRRRLGGFIQQIFSAWDEPAVQVPLELGRQIVYSAIGYARSGPPSMYLAQTWPYTWRVPPLFPRRARPCRRREVHLPGREGSAMPQLEPGHRPPATPPPAPPRGQPRHQSKPSATFRVTIRRPQLWHSQARAVSDLNPDHAVSGPHRDRDRLPRSARAAVPDTVAEHLAHQQCGVIPARVPRAEHPAHERAGDPRPLRPPARTAALAISAPALPRPPRETSGPLGGHRDARPTRRRTSSAIAAPARPVRGCHSGSQRDKVTHDGTEKNGPPAREFAASGPFMLVLAGVGFEPT
jgi:hypothetical protein